MASNSTTGESSDAGSEAGEPAAARDEDQTLTDESVQSIPLDIVFQILSTERRRQVLVYLREGEGSTTLADLADHIAALENDKPERAVTSAERKRVYVALYQCHLPKMADAGVIEYDKARGTVERGPHVDEVVQYLDEPEEPAPRVSDSVFGAILVAGAVTAIGLMQYAPWVSGFLVGCVLAGAVARTGLPGGSDWASGWG